MAVVSLALAAVAWTGGLTPWLLLGFTFFMGLMLSRMLAAVLGFSSAMAAYGAYFIPKSYGTSIALTGGPEAALWVFIAFYVTCIAVTWWFYSRKNAEIPC